LEILDILEPKVGDKLYFITDKVFSLMGTNLRNVLAIKNSATGNYVPSNFDYKKFYEAALDSNYQLSKDIALRFVSSLLTKPFVILTGLAGSGKTKLAVAFAKWICASDDQICVVPVGADWSSREPLLGYPNALQKGDYIKPESGVLDLLLQAKKSEELDEGKPYFLILDEMNLSHVERYFADFLSAMESDEKIYLHSMESETVAPKRISIPKNLFIIGTVNIDETTYMFSPKVLDRANVIEFRISNTEMKYYFDNRKALKMQELFLNKDKNNSTGFLNCFLAKYKALDFFNPEIF
jgi:5-methylcytosine-specific restriction protein B